MDWCCGLQRLHYIQARKYQYFKIHTRKRSCFTGRVTEDDIVWVEALMSKSVLDVQ